MELKFDVDGMNVTKSMLNKCNERLSEAKMHLQNIINAQANNSSGFASSFIHGGNNVLDNTPQNIQVLIDAINNNLINEVDKKIQALQGAESANINLISSTDSLIAETTTEATEATEATVTSAQQINKTAREILTDEAMSGAKGWLFGGGVRDHIGYLDNRGTNSFYLPENKTASQYLRYLSDCVASHVIQDTTITSSKEDISNFMYDYIIQFEEGVANSFNNGASESEIISWGEVLRNRLQEYIDNINGKTTSVSSNTDSLLDKMETVGENMANASKSTGDTQNPADSARQEIIDNFVNKMENIFKVNESVYQIVNPSITPDSFIEEMSRHVAKEVLARTSYGLTEADVYNYMHEHLQKYKGDLDLAFKNGFDKNALTAWSQVILDEVNSGVDAYLSEQQKNTQQSVSSNTDSLLDKMETVGENMANASMSTGDTQTPVDPARQEIIDNFVNKMKDIFKDSKQKFIYIAPVISPDAFIEEMSRHVAKEVLARTNYGLTEDDVYNYMHEHLQKYKGDLDIVFKNGFEADIYPQWANVILDEVNAGVDAYLKDKQEQERIKQEQEKVVSYMQNTINTIKQNPNANIEMKLNYFVASLCQYMKQECIQNGINENAADQYIRAIKNSLTIHEGTERVNLAIENTWFDTYSILHQSWEDAAQTANEKVSGTYVNEFSSKYSLIEEKYKTRDDLHANLLQFLQGDMTDSELVGWVTHAKNILKDVMDLIPVVTDNNEQTINAVMGRIDLVGEANVYLFDEKATCLGIHKFTSGTSREAVANTINGSNAKASSITSFHTELNEAKATIAAITKQIEGFNETTPQEVKTQLYQNLLTAEVKADALGYEIATNGLKQETINAGVAKENAKNMKTIAEQNLLNAQIALNTAINEHAPEEDISALRNEVQQFEQAFNAADKSYNESLNSYTTALNNDPNARATTSYMDANGKSFSVTHGFADGHAQISYADGSVAVVAKDGSYAKVDAKGTVTVGDGYSMNYGVTRDANGSYSVTNTVSGRSYSLGYSGPRAGEHAASIAAGMAAKAQSRANSNSTSGGKGYSTTGTITHADGSKTSSARGGPSC